MKAVYIVIYIASFAVYSLLIKSAQLQGAKFNSTFVVLLSEVYKLIFSIVMVLHASATSSSSLITGNNKHDGDDNELVLPLSTNNNTTSNTTSTTASSSPVLIPTRWFSVKYLIFAVPAILYMIRNNLQYITLMRMNFAAYKLLLNSRFIITGALGLFILGQRLNRYQWLALCVITLGCIMLDFDPEMSYSITFSNASLLILQIMCASIGSILIERSLKDKAHAHVNIDFLNLYLYGFSILFNIPFLTNTKLIVANDLFSPLVHVISLIGALGGIVTGRVLKVMSATTKSFAMACEIIISSAVASYMFRYHVSNILVVSLVLMVTSIFLYNYKPTTSETASSSSSASTSSSSAAAFSTSTGSAASQQQQQQRSVTNNSSSNATIIDVVTAASTTVLRTSIPHPVSSTTSSSSVSSSSQLDKS